MPADMAGPSTRPALPRPAPALLALLVVWALLGLAASIGVVPAAAWQQAGMGLGALALLDLLRAWRRVPPSVQRTIPDTLPIGVERPVRLVLAPTVSQTVDVFDLHPVGWSVSGLPRRLQLRRGESSAFDYRLSAHERGDFVFEGVHLRLHSPWRLWTRLHVGGDPQAVRVFPNFAPLAKFALFSAEQASRLVGAHLKRRRGEGTDFHQMREYRVGDSLRQVDWKATARARKLISREYQDERNQQLVLLLDTGRRLLARDDLGDARGIAHFDHVLDASLVVAYLALRQGDAVGMLAAGGDSAWVPPRRGAGAIEGLLRGSYALQPSSVATDFLAAATALSLRQRRRALVMMVTNLRDEDMDDVLAAVTLLKKRHLVCVASLRETALDHALATDVDDLPGAIRAGATAQYLQQRDRAHEVLRNHGVMVLDVTCAQLPAALVERYLAVKRDGLL